MSKSLRILALALVTLALGIGAVLYVGSGDPSPELPVEGEGPGIMESEPGAQGLRAKAAEREEAKGEDKVEASRIEVGGAGGDWVVRGKVLARDDTPMAGVEFQAELFAGYEAKGSAVLVAKLRSRVDGSFSWGLPAPKGALTMLFRAPSPDVLMFRNTEVVRAGSPPPQDQVLRAYLVDATVTGHVWDEGGKPIAGAHVVYRSSKKPIPCDEEGGYELRVPSSFSRVSLYAGAAGHAALRKTAVAPKPGKTVVLDFRLHPGLTVKGRVVDEAGMPVEGASVRTFFSMRYKTVESDAKGRFVLDYLDRGRPSHSLYARKKGYVEARTRVETVAVQESYELVMKRGVRVHGRVTNKDGAPVAGAQVYIGFDPSAYNRLDCVSAEDGSFDFPHVEAGSQDLVTEAPGYATALHKFEIPKDRTQPMRMDVRLEEGQKVSGVIVDSKGVPLSRIGVAARSYAPGSPMGGRYIGDLAKTNDKGEFELVDMRSGWITIECYGAGFIRHEEKGVKTGGKPVRIQMQRSAGLAGRVVDGGTDKPLDRFRVRIVNGGGGGWSATWSREGFAFIDTDGYWTTGRMNLQPDTRFVLEISAPGMGAVTTEMVTSVQPDRDAHLTRLHPGQKLRGRVVQADSGAPISGARVVAFTAGRPFDPARQDDFQGRVEATTDQAGAFALDNVPTGAVSLAVMHESWPYTVHGPIQVTPGVQPEQIIQIKNPAILRGTLRDARGQPIPGVVVRAFPLRARGGSRGVLEATTDAKGRFRLQRGLGTGIYELQVPPWEKKAPFTVIGKRVEVESDKETMVELAPEGSCELIGTIESKKPIVGHVLISLLRKRADAKPGDLSSQQTYRSRSEGTKIHLRGLPPGDYTVMSFDRMRLARIDVALSEGKPARIVLKFPSKKFAPGR